MPVPNFGYSLSEAKTVVVNKVVHQSGVLDKVEETIGPTHTTRSNELFDPLIGRALLFTATNAFGDPVYSYLMPARWMYPRMGPAYLSSGLKVELTGARLVDAKTVRIQSPSIPACPGDPASSLHTSGCLPLGSRFAADMPAPGTSLVLVEGDARALTLKSTRSLNRVPTGSASLVQSGNQNLLQTNAGTIQALADPTTRRSTPCPDGDYVGALPIVNQVLSATARTFREKWDSIKEDIWFPGSAPSAAQQRTAYAAKDKFSQGLQGMWRPFADYLYVKTREQSTPVNTRTDGTFSLVLFDWSDSPYLDRCAPEWEMKSTVTRYNSANAPTEEKNAAKSLSSALYGFGQTVPVAMGDHAEHDEIAFESFESFANGADVTLDQTGEGNFSFRTRNGGFFNLKKLINLSTSKAHTGMQSLRVVQSEDFLQVKLKPRYDPAYTLSAWVSRDNDDVPTYAAKRELGVQIKFWQGGHELTAQRPALIVPAGPIIAGWQRLEGQFTFPAGAKSISMALQCGHEAAYFDDIRVVPTDAHLETFVYDPATMRIAARLDNNNYATLFDYQPDGSLKQSQRETPRGLLTEAEGRTHVLER